MTAHVLKLVWNRKGPNAFVTLEVIVSFLVLFAAYAIVFHHLELYRQPLGFAWEGVLAIELGGTPRFDPRRSDKHGDLVERMLLEVEALPEVEVAATALWPPFNDSAFITAWAAGGRQSELHVQQVTDHLARTLRIEILAGRWFDPRDSTDSRPAVVIGERLARELFGEEEAVGRVLTEPGAERSRELRVVGVMRDYRPGGHFSTPVSYAFERIEPAETVVGEAVLLVRLRPRTAPTFEEALMSRLHTMAPQWSFGVQSLSERRDRYLRENLMPLLVMALVVAFLMLMVALGLVGVVWQSVIQRTSELGLRRAMGANSGDVARQMLGELLVVAGLGTASGVLVVAQLPVTGWLPTVPGRVYALAVLAGGATLTVLTVLSGLFPSVLASRVQPAETLRHE